VGAYPTLQGGAFPLVVVRGKDGQIRAFHNVCRHRGAKILDLRKGNAATGLKCKYHYWLFNLDGSLRGIPLKDELFPEIDKSDLHLKVAGIGILGGLIFVNPSHEPEESFDEWTAGIEQQVWRHQLEAMTEVLRVQYEVKANWKLIYENANDGYHLAYLHENTLGGPVVGKQETECFGRHSTYKGATSYYSELMEKNSTVLGQALSAALSQMDEAAGGEAGLEELATQARDYADEPDLFFMFPDVVVAPSALGLVLLHIIPLAPNRSISEFRIFAPKGTELESFEGNQFLMPNPGVELSHGDNNPQPITLAMLEGDAMDSLNFQVEDMWICEQMQQGLNSPAYEAGPYAPGPGEGSITFFQMGVLGYMDPERAKIPLTNK